MQRHFKIYLQDIKFARDKLHFVEINFSLQKQTLYVIYIFHK